MRWTVFSQRKLKWSELIVFKGVTVIALLDDLGEYGGRNRHRERELKARRVVHPHLEYSAQYDNLYPYAYLVAQYLYALF